MVFFGLDDSQRPINGNSRLLRRVNGYVSRGVITVHALYSESEVGRDVHYIWTVGPPDVSSHQHHIRNFLEEFCTPSDVVIACVHYFMYPEVSCLPYLIPSNRRRKFKDHVFVYNRADMIARYISKEILNALERQDLERIEMYKKFFFGDFKSYLQ